MNLGIKVLKLWRNNVFSTTPVWMLFVSVVFYNYHYIFLQICRKIIRLLLYLSILSALFEIKTHISQIFLLPNIFGDATFFKLIDLYMNEKMNLLLL